MNNLTAAGPPPAAINLNQPASLLHWSIFQVTEANLVLIAVMIVIFGAALILPFPRGGSDLPATAEPGPDDDARTARGTAQAPLGASGFSQRRG
jgi:hypothetical protein